MFGGIFQYIIQLYHLHFKELWYMVDVQQNITEQTVVVRSLPATQKQVEHCNLQQLAWLIRYRKKIHLPAAPCAMETLGIHWLAAAAGLTLLQCTGGGCKCGSTLKLHQGRVPVLGSHHWQTKVTPWVNLLFFCFSFPRLSGIAHKRNRMYYFMLSERKLC